LNYNLPDLSRLITYDDLVPGLPPTRAIISGLKTGIPCFVRVAASNEIGTSEYSDTVTAIPATNPPRLERLSAGYALREYEVQSVSIVASHISEVKLVKTFAAAIPEVQELAIVSAIPERSIVGGSYSIRIPEVQVVTITAGSPISDGSFFLELEYYDLKSSLLQS